MKFTALVDKVLPHERLTGNGVRETYKEVIHLIVTNPNGVPSATQPISGIAGFLELHVTDRAPDDFLAGTVVTVEIEPKAKAKAAAPAAAKPAAKKAKPKAKAPVRRKARPVPSKSTATPS